ncbi:TonB-dependent receptor plug domain-containing protein [Chitinimonas sp. JJ19]|uniref:TonB-dependent receptor plug domain-containing protein n=1 Tax=Chitinimonas sp. JJ19 TaxID=3109352 RepID=UPI002FFE44EC
MKLNQITRALLLVGIAGGASQFALAEEAPVKVEKIQVTGSNIKRTSTESASPIQVIGREEIRKTGVTTTSELLKLVPAISSGGLDDLDSGTGFASGVATSSLRGLGSSSTLVLVNGRRMAPAAYADPNTGQSSLYNLNNIPLSAIERVEVLKDGASAVYGSDAIAGVINFILRKDYQGAQASLSGGGSLNGGFGNQSGNLSVGFGDPVSNRFNVMVSAEYRHREATPLSKAHAIKKDAYYQLDARLDPSASSLAYPGNYYIERTQGSGAFTVLGVADNRCPTSMKVGTTCRWDFFKGLDAVSESDTGAVFSRASFSLGENLNAFAEVGYNRVEAEYRSNPRSVAQTGSTWFTTDGQRKSFTFVLPANHPDNPYNNPTYTQYTPNNTRQVAVRYRFGDIPSSDSVTNESTRVVLGLDGSHFGWDWNAGAMYSKAEREAVSRGLLLANELQSAINDLSYRPFGNNSAATIAKISPDQLYTGETEVSIGDLKGSTEFGNLPGGAIGVAVGLEARRESIKVTPDARLANAEFIGLGSSAADGSRNVRSVFGEFNLPLLKTLEAEAAVRYDRYSDYGSSTTPKLGLKWTPNGALAVRGSYAEGFRAPGLTQISKSSVQSFNTIIDPLRCGTSKFPDVPANTIDPASRDTGECTTGRSISSRIAANPDLEPEKSKSFTFGLVFAPSANFNGTVDIYQIRRKDEIDRLSSQYIMDQLHEGGESRYADQISRNQNPDTWLRDTNGNIIPNTGPIISTVRKFFNLGESRVKGVDLDLNLRNNLGEFGRLSSNFNASYLISYKQAQFAGDEFVEYAGAYGPAGELPRLKSTLATTWSKGPYSVNGRINYTDGWYYGDGVSGCGGIAAYQAMFPDCKVHSWTTFDLGMTYTGVKNLTIGGTLRNVFDRDAPYDPDNTTIGYNPGFHNPYGRYLSLSATYKFF